jgi:hypothetical protein
MPGKLYLEHIWAYRQVLATKLVGQEKHIPNMSLKKCCG